MTKVVTESTKTVRLKNKQGGVAFTIYWNGVKWVLRNHFGEMLKKSDSQNDLIIHASLMNELSFI